MYIYEFSCIAFSAYIQLNSNDNYYSGGIIEMILALVFMGFVYAFLSWMVVHFICVLLVDILGKVSPLSQYIPKLVLILSPILSIAILYEVWSNYYLFDKSQVLAALLGTLFTIMLNYSIIMLSIEKKGYFNGFERFDG